MAIIRRANVLNEQRWDVPHMRSIESAICNDFDNLAGKGLAGRVPFVLRSFTIPVANTLGQSATLLQLNVASGLIYHYGASESGTVFSVPDNQAPEPLNVNNNNVIGGFIASSTNYIGLDLNRNPDSSTIDTVAILDVTTLTEIPEVVPLAITLQYKIIISTQAFSTSTNILPIAKVVTDSNNNVVSITDTRNMLFRLGSGGDAANALNVYPWGSRSENPITYTGGADPFSGEDKIINNQASWMQAMMTSIWEVKGGEYWYAATNRDNVKLLYGQPTLVANSDNFFYTGTNIQWSGLAVAYENALSSTYFNTITNSASIGGGTGLPLSNGQCLYVDIVRESSAALIPAVTNLWQLGTSVIPGRRFVIAWMYNNLVFVRDKAYEVGRTFPVATTTVLGIVELSAASATPLAPKVISDGGGTINAPSTSSALFINGLTAATPGQGFTFTGGSASAGNTNGSVSGYVIGGNGSGSGNGGNGLSLFGGNGSTTNGVGGTGMLIDGGFGGGGTSFTNTVGTGTGNGGDGIHVNGGLPGTGGAGTGGDAIDATGGAGISAAGGNGITSTGGAAVLAGGTSGHGVVTTGGAGSLTATDGDGIHAVGGGTTGIGGVFSNATTSTGSAYTDAIVCANGAISLDSVVNPNNTLSVKDRITPVNIVKAHANATLNATGFPTLNGGFNLNPTPVTASSTVVVFNWGQAFIDGNYTCTVSILQNSTSNFYVPQIYNQVAGSVSIELLTLNPGSPGSVGATVIPSSASGITIEVIAIGRQT